MSKGQITTIIDSYVQNDPENMCRKACLSRSFLITLLTYLDLFLSMIYTLMRTFPSILGELDLFLVVQLRAQNVKMFFFYLGPDLDLACDFDPKILSME